jgi:hypothetical protein
MKTSTIISMLLFFAGTAVVSAEDKPACSTSWTCYNGNTAGPVNSKESCEEACRACEGGDWRCPDLKSRDVEVAVEMDSEVTEANTDANMTAVGNETSIAKDTIMMGETEMKTFYKCQCGKVSSTSTCGGSERRDLCVDPEYDAASRAFSATTSVSLVAIALALGLLLML